MKPQSCRSRFDQQRPLAKKNVMRVLIANDALHPQVNGVVRTLTALARSAKRLALPEGAVHDRRVAQ
jgi:hypothetical protein